MTAEQLQRAIVLRVLTGLLRQCGDERAIMPIPGEDCELSVVLRGGDGQGAVLFLGADLYAEVAEMLIELKLLRGGVDQAALEIERLKRGAA